MVGFSLSLPTPLHYKRWRSGSTEYWDVVEDRRDTKRGYPDWDYTTKHLFQWWRRNEPDYPISNRISRYMINRWGE